MKPDDDLAQQEKELMQFITSLNAVLTFYLLVMEQYHGKLSSIPEWEQGVLSICNHLMIKNPEAVSRVLEAQPALKETCPRAIMDFYSEARGLECLQ